MDVLYKVPYIGKPSLIKCMFQPQTQWHLAKARQDVSESEFDQYKDRHWLEFDLNGSSTFWQPFPDTYTTLVYKCTYIIIFTIFANTLHVEWHLLNTCLKGDWFTLQRQNTEISKQIFPEKEYRGLSPNFHIHSSVSDLYIPTIGLPIVLEEICRSILGLYKSLTDTWMWKLGLRPRYSQKKNT